MTFDLRENVTVGCPYCGEKIFCEIDTSITEQQYIEDCYVCCAPIVFEIMIDRLQPRIHVSVRREND
jgi:hypothetical protein